MQMFQIVLFGPTSLFERTEWWTDDKSYFRNDYGDQVEAFRRVVKLKLQVEHAAHILNFYQEQY